jgi:hypothetical protein
MDLGNSQQQSILQYKITQSSVIFKVWPGCFSIILKHRFSTPDRHHTHKHTHNAHLNVNRGSPITGQPLPDWPDPGWGGGGGDQKTPGGEN